MLIEVVLGQLRPFKRHFLFMIQSPVVLQPVEVATPVGGRVRRQSDLIRALEPIIREYFEHGDSSEVHSTTVISFIYPLSPWRDLWPVNYFYSHCLVWDLFSALSIIVSLTSRAFPFQVFEEIAEMGDDWDKEVMIKLAVSFAMDRKASHRELTSRLISDLYGEQVLDQHVIAKGDL